MGIKVSKPAKLLLAGASTFAISIYSGSFAHAQDADDGQEVEQNADDEIIVRGIRRSIQNAQEIKRNSDTFVDAITAADIGALPDRSVSEALQRVPGVSIIRFAGPNDPDHFAVEGSGVVVRGLPFVRSELNGRDVFAANASGVLGFEDVSPELLGSVQVFKNQSADLIEGGLAGTIDLRTRLPFDQSDQILSFSIEGNLGDLSDDFTPTVSGLYSNSWDTNAGRFGILLNGSFSELSSRADATQIANFRSVDINGSEVFVPSGGGIRTQDFDREREAYAAAAQWESPDKSWLATFQFLRSDSNLTWGERVIETQADGSGDPAGFDSSDFVFDDDGLLTSGTISDNSQWRGPNATAALFPTVGGQSTIVTRERDERDVTSDYAFNLKFAPTDRLRFNGDIQYITSTSDVTDLAVYTSFFSPVRITDNGQVPGFSYVSPTGDPSYFSDLSNHFIRAFADQISQNEADELAFRADVEYDFSGDGWLKSIRAGARYADQETQLRESDFNWGNISEVWTGRDINNTAVQPDGSFDFNSIESTLLLAGNTNPALNDVTAGLFGQESFPGFQRGNNGPLGFTSVPFYTGPLTGDYEGFVAVRQALIDATGGPTGSRAFCGSPFSSLALRECTNGDEIIPGTPFTQSEIANIDRESFALYTRLDFGSDSLFNSSMTIDGNIGLRYVNTDRSVTTAQLLPSFDGLFPTAAQCDPAFIAANPGNNTPGFCSLDLATLQAAFGTGAVNIVPVDTSYDEWLPSLNAKIGLSEDQLIRFAVSRTLSRPGNDQLNQRPVVQTLPELTIDDGAGGTTNVFNGFVGTFSGNAQLLPQTAWNFDLSWEWYFAETGSLTLSAFHKTINNFITFSALDVPGPDGTPITIDNQPIQFNTEVNSDENATLTGFEIAYTQFYDFLPGPFDGLGAQFNYTYIDADGVPSNIDQALFVGEINSNPPAPRFAVDDGVFPRVSEHNINAVALYEKGPIQARIAYNWRSEFQVTPRDVIFPFASIYQPATGQVDFSAFYNVNENWKVGVQGVNILDDITVTTNSINDAGLRGPRSFFRNDRRFTFILRATY